MSDVSNNTDIFIIQNDLEREIVRQTMVKIDVWCFSFPVNRPNFHPKDHPLGDKYKIQLIASNEQTKDRRSVIMYVKGNSLTKSTAIRIEADCCYEESICFTLNELVEHLNSCEVKL